MVTTYAPLLEMCGFMLSVARRRATHDNKWSESAFLKLDDFMVTVVAMQKIKGYKITLKII